jgi:hypothetical protein
MVLGRARRLRVLAADRAIVVLVHLDIVCVLQRLKEGEQAVVWLEVGSLAVLVRLEFSEGCFLECKMGMQVGLRRFDRLMTGL